MVEIEKQGTPTVLIVSGRFEHDARASARAFAMPGIRYVVVPWIYRNLDRDRTLQQTEAAFDTLVGELTGDLQSLSQNVQLRPTRTERFEGDRLPGSPPGHEPGIPRPRLGRRVPNDARHGIQRSTGC